MVYVAVVCDDSFLQVDAMYKASQDLFPEYDKIKSIEKVRRNLRNTIRDVNTVLGIADRVRPLVPRGVVVGEIVCRFEQTIRVVCG